MVYKEKLISLFEHYDTKAKWGVAPYDAMELLLWDEEIHLRKHTIEAYVSRAMDRLEFAAYESKSTDLQFTLDRTLNDQIRDILADSPYGRIEIVHHDLSSATEIMLPDGTVLPINNHLSRSG